MRAAERKNDGDIRTQPVKFGEIFRELRLYSTNAYGEEFSNRLRAHGLTHALCTVTSKSVGDFMPHHYSDTIVVLDDRHNSFPKSHFAARKTERVHLCAL